MQNSLKFHLLLNFSECRGLKAANFPWQGAHLSGSTPKSLITASLLSKGMILPQSTQGLSSPSFIDEEPDGTFARARLMAFEVKIAAFSCATSVRPANDILLSLPLIYFFLENKKEPSSIFASFTK